MAGEAGGLIYKVADRALFEAAAATGVFNGMPVDLADGYIHFSAADQLAETIRKHFAGKPDLMLFAVPADRLGPDLRWEPSRGGALFPHLYRPLDMSLVVHHQPLFVAADGSAKLPGWVK
ncbi:MAG: DUF952 domain-containing protein [Devosia sp.]